MCVFLCSILIYKKLWLSDINKAQQKCNISLCSVAKIKFEQVQGTAKKLHCGSVG